MTKIIKPVEMAEHYAPLLNLYGALKRIEALTIAGDKLAWFAGHEDGCASSVCWADPAPCDCGYREAWKNWQEAREYD